MEDSEKAKLLLNDYEELDLYEYIKDKYNIKEVKQIDFIIEWISSSCYAYTAYKKIYGPDYKAKKGKVMPTGSAKSSASRLLSSVNFGMQDYLDLRGHGLDVMMDVLTVLRKTEPKEYMKYILKLRGLDTQNVKMSGSVEIPGLVINTYKTEEE